MIADTLVEFGRYRRQAEEAMTALDDAAFFQKPGSAVNSAAIIVKHVAGNLLSRWTDFLTTDGEKPNRNRDGEFQIAAEDSRAALMQAWDRGFAAVTATLQALSDSQLDQVVKIRGESHTVRQATIRSLAHTAYHAGQILYIVRLLKPDSKWLTIPPGQSQSHTGSYLPTKSVTK